jgi:DNA adenine methylase
LPHLKLIKYPGSKSSLIPTISKIFIDSQATTFIDVFGGSGIVSLNIDSPKTIYNDINKDLYNLFKVIKYYPDLLLDQMRKWTVDKNKFHEFEEIFNSKGVINLTNLDKAFRTFYGFSIGFGGMGSTYRTNNEKSTYTQTLKVISNYNSIRAKISQWTIENLDFKDLFVKYDDPKAFFYCDPPYSGKDWYQDSFDTKNLEELKSILSNIKGKYLLSFNKSDPVAEETFGPPKFVVEFEDQNRKKIPNETAPLRRFSIYTNIL